MNLDVIKTVSEIFYNFATPIFGFLGPIVSFLLGYAIGKEKTKKRKKKK